MRLQVTTRFEPDQRVAADVHLIALSGTMKVLVSEPADNTETNQDVRGNDIPILRVRLSVKSAATAGTYALSMDIQSMITLGSNLVVENGAALVLDHRDGGSTQGELVVAERAYAVAERRLDLVPNISKLNCPHGRTKCKYKFGSQALML